MRYQNRTISFAIDSRSSIVGDDNHLFCLQFAGRIGLDAAQYRSRPLADRDRRNSVAVKFRSHALDSPVQNASAPLYVARNFRPRIDIDQRHRLRGVPGGGVELPFGGVGKSGHGREKGFEALYGFSALKTVAAWHG